MRNAFCAAFFGAFAIAGIACSSSSSTQSSPPTNDTTAEDACHLPANSQACPPEYYDTDEYVGKACAPAGTKCTYEALDNPAGECLTVEVDCNGETDASTGNWSPPN
jgi:hypothetical protein